LNVAGAVRCWGLNYFGQSNVPSNLGVVTQVSAGDWHTCVLNVAGAVRCWGLNDSGRTIVPLDLGNVTQISAGSSHTCALNVAGAVRCWGDNRKSQSDVPSRVYESGVHVVFKQLDSQQIENIEGHMTGSLTLGSVSEAQFALDEAGIFYYQWFRNGLEISGAMQRTYEITEQDVGTNLMATAVHSDGNKAYFGSTPAILVEPRLVSFSVPSVAGTRKIGGTLIAGSHDGDNGATFSYQWLRNGDAIVGATESKYVVTLNDLGADLTVGITGYKIGYRSFTQSSTAQKISNSIPKSPCFGSLDTSKPWLGTGSQPSIDPLPYPPFPAAAGDSLKGHHGEWPLSTKFCVFWMANGHQIIPGANSPTYPSRLTDGGKSLQYVVVGTDKQGKRSVRFSNPVTLEPCVGSSVTVKPLNAVNGITKRVSGTLYTCRPVKTVQYREKAVGKHWTGWQVYPVTNQFEFSIDRTFGSNGKYEVRVNNAGTWLSSGEQDVRVRLKYALPLSFYTKSARNPQGFNQGGNITIKFTGDKEFNGTCTVISKTNQAFNFAGVAIGDESKFTHFNVRNGFGSGLIRMRWNGVAAVNAVCVDPKFIDIYDSRYATFRTNF
jgi:hypothetical protein